ncbi:MAG TPA: hypothetical protein VIT45_16860 [Allosphingosinicella sp.]
MSSTFSFGWAQLPSVGEQKMTRWYWSMYTVFVAKLGALNARFLVHRNIYASLAFWHGVAAVMTGKLEVYLPIATLYLLLAAKR